MDVIKGEDWTNKTHNPPPGKDIQRSRQFDGAVASSVPYRRDRPSVNEERHLAMHNRNASPVEAFINILGDPNSWWQAEPHKQFQCGNRRQGKVTANTVIDTDGDGEIDAKEVADAVFMGFPNLGSTSGAGNSKNTAECQGRMEEHLEDLRERYYYDDSPFMSARKMFFSRSPSL